MADPKTDTVRIVLPSRPPVTPIRRLPPKITPALSSSSLLQPLPKPPETETARISVLPRPGTVPVAPVVTPRPVAPVDAIPRSLAWGLLVVSAVIFLIQIWNYVVS